MNKTVTKNRLRDDLEQAQKRIAELETLNFIEQDEHRQAEKRLRSLLEISQALTLSLDTSFILQQIVDNSTKATGLDSGAIYTLEGSQLYLAATTPALPPGFPDKFRRAELTDHPRIQTAIQECSPILVPDTAAAELTEAERAVAEARGLRSIAYLPLMIARKAIGVLIVASTNDLRSFPAQELYLYQGFSGQAAQVIENVRLYESVKSRAMELEQQIVERKQAEEKMRLSEERYRLISSTVSDYVFSTRVDAQGGLHLEWVAGAFEEITGYSYQEYVALGGWVAMLHPDDRAADRQALADLLQCRKVISEIRTVRKDGSVVWVQVYATPLWDPTQNRLAGIYGAVKDISKRKQAEQELAESEEKFRSVVECSPDIIFSVDRETRIRFINRVPPGVTTEECLGKSALDFVLPEYHPVVESAIRRVFETGQSGWYEIQARGPHDLPAWYSTRLASIYRGTPNEQVLLITEDVTARKEAADNLHLSQARYQSLVETQSDLVARSDPSGRLTFVNSAYCRTLGFEQEELLGRQFRDFIYPDDLQVLESTVQAIERPPHRQYIESRLVTPGGVRWFGWENVALLSENGAVIEFQGVGRDITERKRTEQALLESKQHLSTIFEASQDAIGITRLSDGKIFSVNAAFENLYEYSRHECIGRTTAELKLWAIASDRERFVEALKREGIVRDVETIARLKSGAERYVLVSGKQVEINGELCLMAQITDITARKQAEEKLRASEEKYRVLLQSLDSAVVMFDCGGKFLYMNDNAARQLGGAPEQFIGKRMDQVFPLPVAHNQMAELEQVIAANKGQVFESLSFVGGQPRWYRTSIQPMHDKTGQVEAVLINTTDIHELKLTQQQLQELNRSLEEKVAERTAEVMDLYDNAPNGYLSLDAQGNLIRINQTELNWLGYTREQVIGQPFENYLDAPSRATAAEQFRHLQQHGVIQDLALDVVRQDGSVMPVLVNATAILDAQGNAGQSRFAITDHTQQKKAEEALRVANAGLERAMRAKDEFLANMSHELRTPLNAILGLSESLLEQYIGPLNERQVTALQTVVSSGEHLLALINDILDLSKIESGNTPLHIEAVPVAEMCEASLVFVKQAALRKHIRLAQTLDLQVEQVMADARRLKQMLVNLLMNAVKFTPEGGQVALEVQGDAEKNLAYFAVRDTGIGIAAEHLSRLFKPFVQVDSSMTRQYEGTGLGLALVSRLAELHGGTVSVESEPGKGSTFTLALPWKLLESYAPVNGAYAMQTRTPDFAVPADADKPLVLVAEDNEANRFMISTRLESRGYRLLTAANGLEALNLARQHRPALVLMDLQMPVMDGLEVIRQLRKDSDPQIAAMPIIAVTAFAMSDDRQRALQAGANEYMSKPIDMETLLLLMRFLAAKQ